MLRVKFLINNNVDVEIDVEKTEFINNFSKHFDLSDRISILEWIDESDYRKAILERLWGYFVEFKINNSNKIYTDYGLIAIKE